MRVVRWMAVLLVLAAIGCSSPSEDESRRSPDEQPDSVQAQSEIAETSPVGDGELEEPPNDLAMRWRSRELIADLDQHSSRAVEVGFEVFEPLVEVSLALSGELRDLAGTDTLPIGSLDPGSQSTWLVLNAPVDTAPGAEFAGSIELVVSGESAGDVLPATVTLVARSPELVTSELLAPSSARLVETEVGLVVADELIAFVDGELQAAEQLASEHGLDLLGASSASGLYQLLVPRGQGREDLRTVAEALEEDNRVVLAMPSVLGVVDGVRYPDEDNLWPRQFWGTVTPGLTWHLETIRAPEAWAHEVGDTNPATVAILDIDFDRRHEDLTFLSLEDVAKTTISPAGRVANGWGHGNIVAGIACADANNGVGISGVSWGCNLRAYNVGEHARWNERTQVYDADVYPAAVFDAMVRAASEGARVVNLSFGHAPGDCGTIDDLSQESRWIWSKLHAGYSATTERARQAASKGREPLWITSAGNEGCDQPFDLPSWMTTAGGGSEPSYGDVWISVAATDRFGELSDFSNHSPETTTLAAPGGNRAEQKWVNDGVPGGQNILTTTVCDPSIVIVTCARYLEDYGTSVATPLVTGVAALMFSANPDLTAAQAKTCLVESTRDRVVPGHGFGIIDVEQSVACAVSLPRAEQLIEEFATKDEFCRGGPGDNETNRACNERADAQEALDEIGWCLGRRSDTHGNETWWHLCLDDSWRAVGLRRYGVVGEGSVWDGSADAPGSRIVQSWGIDGPIEESLGSSDARGSGCSPGSEKLPDGVWFGFIRGLDESQLGFDLACWYSGDVAVEKSGRPAGESNYFFVINDNDAVRNVPVSSETRFYLHFNQGQRQIWPNLRKPWSTAEFFEMMSHVDERPWGRGLWEHAGVWVLIEDGELVELLEFFHGHVS